jgi:hypothetical protein
MPQPVYSDVHVQAALTMISTAYLQNEANYIADKIFPVVPVPHQSDKYFVYSKDDYFRDEAQKRADATESAGGGFNLSTSSYSADVWAFHKDVGDQTRRNADPAVDIDVATTKFIMQRLLIRRDRFFQATYMTTNIWGNDVTGATSGNGSTTATYWSDDANSDPFSDVATGVTTILQNTGYEPNKLVIGWPVYQALRKNPLVIDRIKYTMQADARKITPELLAAAFDVDEVIVSKAVYNSAAENVAGSYSFVMGKNALLVYSAPAAGLMIPSGGYIFAWQGLSGLNNIGVRILQIPVPLRGANTVRTEGEMAFDMKVIGTDLGYFFSAIVQ